MTTRADKTYQHPQAPGSLSGLLHLWQRLRRAGHDGATSRVTFILSCQGEARATRVAGHLRRRRGCEVTRVDRVGAGRHDTWRVHGAMHPAIHSLTDLEATWTWLQDAAHSHQVNLLRIALAPAAAA